MGLLEGVREAGTTPAAVLSGGWNGKRQEGALEMENMGWGEGLSLGAAVRVEEAATWGGRSVGPGL